MTILCAHILIFLLGLKIKYSICTVYSIQYFLIKYSADSIWASCLLPGLLCSFQDKYRLCNEFPLPHTFRNEHCTPVRGFIWHLLTFSFTVWTQCVYIFFSVKLVVFVYSSKLNKTLLGMSHFFFCCGSLTPVSHLHWKRALDSTVHRTQHLEG